MQPAKTLASHPAGVCVTAVAGLDPVAGWWEVVWAGQLGVTVLLLEPVRRGHPVTGPLLGRPQHSARRFSGQERLLWGANRQGIALRVGRQAPHGAPGGTPRAQG